MKEKGVIEARRKNAGRRLRAREFRKVDRAG